MKNKIKPQIRYIQPHINGELYIQFNDQDPFEMAHYYDSQNIEYLIECKNDGMVLIKGQDYRKTKSGIILSNWNIKRLGELA